MNENALIEYYNKFNEDKRLTTKHGQVEFLTAMEYIKEYLKMYENAKIVDIGAGCGAYSIPLSEAGHDVTAVELVKHNLKVIESKSNKVKCICANAMDMHMLQDESFDVALLFGPMYHLISTEEKIQCLKEVKRILKKDGLIFITYCMNEYALITHGIKEGFLNKSIEDKNVDYDFHIISNKDDLYSYVRLEDINMLNDKAELERVKIINQDGPTEYLKREINQMDENTFKNYFSYHIRNCERPELLGAGRHILDIVKKK
jgi:ubiquinone/menaquinone biosynthesis C-methylase UbiE